MDGRSIAVPLASLWNLLDAIPDQRAHWKPAGAGYGIHWSHLDEDFSTQDLLHVSSVTSEAVSKAR